MERLTLRGVLCAALVSAGELSPRAYTCRFECAQVDLGGLSLGALGILF